MPRGLNQYGFKIKRGPDEPSHTKSIDGTFVAAANTQQKPKARKVSTTSSVQHTDNARKQSAGANSTVLKSKGATKVTKSKTPSKSSKSKTNSGVRKATSKLATRKAPAKSAAQSSKSPPHAAALNISTSTATHVPSLPVSKGTEKAPVAKTVASSTSTTSSCTRKTSAMSQIHAVRLVDAARSVETRARVEHEADPKAAAVRPCDVTCAPTLPLEPHQSTRELADRLISKRLSTNTPPNDTGSALKATLPTRYRKHVAPSNPLTAPAQSSLTNNNQFQGAGSESAECRIQIPKLATGSRNANKISFSPVRARLMPSADGFDEYSIVTGCRIPTGSASKVEILRAFKKHIKTDVPVIACSAISEEITSAANYSSEDEPLMNTVAARRALAANQATAHKVSRTVGASSKGAAASKASVTATHHRLSMISCLSASVPSKRNPSNPKPSTRRPTPRRGPSFRHPTPARAKTPTRSDTPARHRPRTPVPPTIRRRRYWERLEALLPAYFARVNGFARRKMFTGPTTAGVRLERLETFWGVLVDLIAENEIFAKEKGWEDDVNLLERVNERMGRGVFGEEEGMSVMTELGKQRMLIVAGGRVMLTRNTLSTRLS